MREAVLFHRQMEYLHEFKLVEVKQDDLTEEEIQLWKKIGDPFDQEDKIRVMRWSWNGQILIDMNAWPGDNESGAVFLDDQIVFTNSDQALDHAEDCPDDLAERLESYQHVRIQWCLDYNHPPIHEHCVEMRREYDRLVD